MSLINKIIEQALKLALFAFAAGYFWLVDFEKMKGK
nr:MAG TPA: hypothetical protein [Caudoviricetes sp.]